MSSFSNANQGISPSQNYYAAGLYMPEVLPYILKIKKWENVINDLTMMLGTPVYQQNVVFRQYFGESNLPTGTVLTRTVPTGNTNTLVITVDPNANFGRVNGIIRDSVTQTQAKITSTTQNTYVIQLFQSGTGATTFASADFSAGKVFTYAANSPEYRLAGNLESQYLTFDYRNIAMQVFEEHTSLHKEDFTDKKWQVMSTNSADNSKMLAHVQVTEMLDRFRSQMEYAYCGFAPQNIVDVNGVNKANALAGIPAQIQQNGFFNEQPVLTEAGLQQTIEYVRDQQGAGADVLCLCGSDFMAWFQNTVGNHWGLYTGANNLFGGASVQGLDYVTYQYLGTRVHFKIYNGFNNQNWFPAYSTVNPAQLKYKSSALFFNTNPVDTYDNGTQPFITRYCYGTNAEYMRDAQMTVVEYGIDMNGVSKPIATNAQQICDWDIQSTNTVLLNDPTKHAYMGIE